MPKRKRKGERKKVKFYALKLGERGLRKPLEPLKGAGFDLVINIYLQNSAFLRQPPNEFWQASKKLTLVEKE
jgi:hypothetical protein